MGHSKKPPGRPTQKFQEDHLSPTGGAIHSADAAADTSSEAASSSRASKDRPGSTQKATERLEGESPAAAAQEDNTMDAGAGEASPHPDHFHFYGADLLRSRLPKTLELAEAVVNGWKKDGDFEDLPISQPLVQFATRFSLRKAKEIEKKMEKSGVVSLAKTGLEFAKSKLQRPQ